MAFTVVFFVKPAMFGETIVKIMGKFAEKAIRTQ